MVVPLDEILVVKHYLTFFPFFLHWSVSERRFKSPEPLIDLEFTFFSAPGIQPRIRSHVVLYSE